MRAANGDFGDDEPDALAPQRRILRDDPCSCDACVALSRNARRRRRRRSYKVGKGIAPSTSPDGSTTSSSAAPVDRSETPKRSHEREHHARKLHEVSRSPSQKYPTIAAMIGASDMINVQRRPPSSTSARNKHRSPMKNPTKPGDRSHFHWYADASLGSGFAARDRSDRAQHQKTPPPAG